eukprot:366376-Chlamydomonas_euryale.AAC.1
MSITATAAAALAAAAAPSSSLCAQAASPDQAALPPPLPLPADPPYPTATSNDGMMSSWPWEAFFAHVHISFMPGRPTREHSHAMAHTCCGGAPGAAPDPLCEIPSEPSPLLNQPSDSGFPPWVEPPRGTTLLLVELTWPTPRLNEPPTLVDST